MGDIDDSLYSRQRCVLGDDAMRKLSRSKVFLLGLGGVGAEIAKNLVLGGVEELIIQDNTVCSTVDMGTQFFIRDEDVAQKKTRAEATLPHLIALNPYVRITMETKDLNGIRGSLSDEINEEIFRVLWKEEQTDDQQIKCLILTQCLLNTAATLNLFCRRHGIGFIYTDVYGVLGNMFCDFGVNFVIRDPLGEPPKEFFIGHLEKVSANQLNIKVYGDRRHQLESGNVVRFTEIGGMTELNDREFTVNVISPSEFFINVATDSLSPYTGGGMGTQVIVPQVQSYESMLKQLREPTIVTTDLSRPDEGHMLHLIFLALAKFCQDRGRYPEPWNESDVALFRAGFEVLLDLFPHKVDSIDEDLLRRIVLVSTGQLAPLCAFFGGVAAQEAMKAVSGSFSPFRQWLYMQCSSVAPVDFKPEKRQWNNSRYDLLEMCVGPLCVRALQSLSGFLVGCGAIGCELLKNLALLGVATSGDTDQIASTEQASPSVVSKAGSGLVTAEENKIPNMNSLSSSSSPSRAQQDQTTTTQTEDTSIPLLYKIQPGAVGDVISDEFVPFTSSASPTTSPISQRSGTIRHHTGTSTVRPTPNGSACVEEDYDTRRANSPSEMGQSIHATLTDPILPEHLERRISNQDECRTKDNTNESPSSRMFSSAPEHKIPRMSSDELPKSGSETHFSTATESIDPVNTHLHSGTSTRSFDPDSVIDPSKSSLVSKTSFRPLTHLVITDPDHIEKSNLNRQFLFRPEHIGQSKSQVAAEVVRQINPSMRIRPMEQKISEFTEETVFTDAFLLEATGSEAPHHSEQQSVSGSRHTGVVLAALDCVPSRRYLDRRCVALHLPLFESGTLGTKGHVQVVLPNQTESYNSQFDDDSGAGDGPTGAGSIPYCTLKSFPSLPVHCIEWAREKFASQFTLKPNKLSQLIASAGADGPNLLIQLASRLLGLSSSLAPQPTESCELKSQENWLRSQLTRSLARFLASRPVDWAGCVRLGRDKFERYFNHKAARLLHAFPPGTKLANGSPFWQLPKRQPTPLTFDSSNPLHRLFVNSFARLVADQLQLAIPQCASGPISEVSEEHILTCLKDYAPPKFVPSNRRIVVDEDEPPPSVTGDAVPGMDESEHQQQQQQQQQLQSVPMVAGDDAVTDVTTDSRSTSIVPNILDEHTTRSLHLLITTLQNAEQRKVVCACRSVKFEKDDDSLAHVDFITSAANLRATMYGLPVTARHEVRRIAGRIVPAIATTTAAVAGLVSLELVKLIAARVRPESDPGTPSTVTKSPQEGSDARNAFLNLALPVILLSEPGPCTRTRLPNGTEFTLWDVWVIPMPTDWESYRLSELITDLKRRYGLQAAVVTQSNRMVYVACLPMHQSRLAKPLKDFLSFSPNDDHVDLMVAYDAGPDQPADADYIRGPPVRLLLPQPILSTPVRNR